ncbi:hypothetical protein LV716_01125 [Flagellimonas sp. HMM57]|uniref:FKBP-type peptidyl-prolyl cis-trans isomerase n=1 Tax=unclassified Flagellimonas TaxID=2644544 RepID=UPI0013D49151|nr:MULTISPECIES: hypothetical protein [unclassified Flagellimonas]UII76418.1 hypothetical protein LV716_01125 [Flagellimonas sp. HMM57]
MKYGVFVCLFCIILFTSCNNDDNGVTPESVPPRVVSEVAPENDEEIQEFLKTHFYNYDEFRVPPVDFDFKIRIDTIAGDNADKKSLWEEIEIDSIKISSAQFGLDDGEEDIVHRYYYLIARNGEGGNPTIADSTFLKYEGTLLDGTLFDGSTRFLWQELPFFLRGFSNGVSKISSGTTDQITQNADGTISISNSGIGLVVMPSGLAYYNEIRGNIPQYAPLLFKLEVGLFVEDTDNDNDGIPSILEDLDGDGNLFNDNTDLQSEIDARLQTAFPNFRDADDDGDGKLTRDEISDEEGNIIIPYPDSNNDGIPDYLDPNVN